MNHLIIIYQYLGSVILDDGLKGQNTWEEQ